MRLIAAAPIVLFQGPARNASQAVQPEVTFGTESLEMSGRSANNTPLVV